MRRLVWLGVITLVMAGVLFSGVQWGKAAWKPGLAIDLAGGTSIVLEPKVSAGHSQQINKDQLQQAVSIIRQRVDSTGVSEAEISTSAGRNIVVNLPGHPDKHTRQLIEAAAQLEFRPVLVQGQPAPVNKQPSQKQTKSPGISKAEQKKLNRLNGDSGSKDSGSKDKKSSDKSTGHGGGVAHRIPAAKKTPDSGKNKDSANKSGADSGKKSASDDTPTSKPKNPSDPAWITPSVAKKYAKLDCTKAKNRSSSTVADPNKATVSCSDDGKSKFILGPVEVPGQDVKDAEFGYVTGSNGAQTSEPAVNLTFNSDGTSKFRKVTQRITGLQQPRNQFAIVLDGQVISAPVSQAIISDGHAQISGNFTQDSATTLANQLKNGALPISFQVQTEQTISATLGSSYLAKGMLAGVIGLLLVVVYSLLQYRVLGFVTVASLVVAGIMTYLLLGLVSWHYGYRLSLSGIAGIIVAIGMTADSFIVYFERVRDELRSGRSLSAAVDTGWFRAERTIYASKSVNFLSAVVLYLLAVGSVRGFAFTLGLTTIVDVIIVVLFTHPTLQLLSQTRFFWKGHPLSGLDPRRLGVSKATYRGALNLDLGKRDASGRKKKGGKKNAAAEGEARRRMTIAERKAAEQEAEFNKKSDERQESHATTNAKDD
ncbi:protein translocase subunit SecD [Spelaeicoccus albus]|uniref:Protein translocase subunit SecD n=1 Tax=Spelaeicoccus albus TaxID=1280376 RepID=A0A7Z0D4C4_9MICO|nr:preprotein translocase subunit SecD [Spelaeicoccus albus]